MKTLSYLVLAITSILFFSCSSDETVMPLDESTSLLKIQEFSNERHTIEIYASTQTLLQGYNDIALRIRDKTTNQYKTASDIQWIPMMQMHSMQHSCPKSELALLDGQQTIYGGYIVFQMPQNDTEFWKLTVNYTIDGNTYSANGQLNVTASNKRTVNTFTGADGNSYIVALVQPNDPKVALNDMTVGVYKMQDMMSFPAVDLFTIKIDPRMPSMGNHGSPNNTDLTQTTSGGLYHGKLSFTMSGLWKINMQLVDASGTVVKGEPITTENPSSSLFFELEF